MGVRWARLVDTSLSTNSGIADEYTELERWLWVLAVAAFGLGDVFTTTIGQTLGLYETNPIFRLLFEVFPVLPVMVLGMGLQLVLAGLLADRLGPTGRLVIPTVLSLLGLRVLIQNLTAIASVL